MVDLEEFSKQLNDLILPFAESAGVTIGLYNQSRKLVASAGVHCNRLHTNAGKNTPVDHVLQHAHPLIIKNPREHLFCTKCSLSSDCLLSIEILTPVIDGQKCVGVITLSSWNAQDALRIIEKQAYFTEMIRQISFLIILRQNWPYLHNQIHRLETYLQSAIDICNESALVIDLDERIAAVSGTAAFLLHMPKDSLRGRKISDIVPHQVTEAVRGGRLFKIIDVEGIRWEGRPIGLNKDLQGMVLLLAKTEKGNKRNSQQKPRFGLIDIRGTSKAITLIKEKVQRIAATELNVLIRGESGTGKELFAGAIHSESFRQGGPFIAINCAALPENLMESELFGYEEGAFTGAKKGGKPGKFELANGGTLFLDEIGDMPLFLQAKLLRALQFKEVERVGGTQAIPVDIRVIAATNKPLEQMIAEGTFREDLYYRLNVVPLDIPPLRERIEDITVLLELFTKRINYNRGTGAIRWSAEALNAIYKYHWPGNVRELENAVEYAVSMTVMDKIDISSLPERIIKSVQSINQMETLTQSTTNLTSRQPHLDETKHKSSSSDLSSPSKSNKLENMSSQAIQTISENEIQEILEALKIHGTTTKGKELAAQSLGIGRATMYRRLKVIKSLGYLDKQH